MEDAGVELLSRTLCISLKLNIWHPLRGKCTASERPTGLWTNQRMLCIASGIRPGICPGTSHLRWIKAHGSLPTWPHRPVLSVERAGSSPNSPVVSKASSSSWWGRFPIHSIIPQGPWNISVFQDGARWKQKHISNMCQNIITFIHWFLSQTAGGRESVKYFQQT